MCWQGIQTINIPMGKDCVPLLANLYFFNFEYKFMKNLSKVRSFTYSFQYIDDFLTIVLRVILPGLVLNKTTESNNLTTESNNLYSYLARYINSKWTIQYSCV